MCDPEAPDNNNNNDDGDVFRNNFSRVILVVIFAMDLEKDA